MNKQIFFNETNGGVSISNYISNINKNDKIKFAIGKLSIRSTINILNSIKLKIAICLYKYKKYKNKIMSN